MAKDILITGARGYLGGRLVRHLAGDPGFAVRGASRDPSRKPDAWPANVPLTRLDPLAQDEGELAEAMSGAEAIVHLAAASNEECQAHPETVVKDAVTGTRNLLNAARRANVRRFVFLSTIHVYGAPLPEYITEETPTAAARPYALAHLEVEKTVLEAVAEGGMDGVVLRLSNAIGAPAWMKVDRWELVGNDMCQQAVKMRRILLTSNGLPWRDFLLLGDFTRAIRHVLDLPREDLGDGLFNLGGRLPLRMIDLAQIVARRASALLGAEIPVERPLPAPGEMHPQIDFRIDRIAATGFEPSPPSALDAEIDATLALCLAAAERR